MTDETIDRMDWCQCGHSIPDHAYGDFHCPTCRLEGGPCAEKLARPPGYEGITQRDLQEAVKTVRNSGKFRDILGPPNA
jgi:hypothetical protein